MATMALLPLIPVESNSARSSHDAIIGTFEIKELVKSSEVSTASLPWSEVLQKDCDGLVPELSFYPSLSAFDAAVSLSPPPNVINQAPTISGAELGVVSGLNWEAMCFLVAVFNFVGESKGFRLVEKSNVAGRTGLADPHAVTMLAPAVEQIGLCFVPLSIRFWAVGGVAVAIPIRKNDAF
ncbi:hypothetical protein Nepgr_008040 [Nepenthes gracilis]|uniref:Uncharacterized protein n=1 Tax=Nepenthes gracilis TaxID=150966 RepID=A0AAD3S822_NEPGR|nr:hypothetical protein Nepgr_008040 [Nepenthes gracilis]